MKGGGSARAGDRALAFAGTTSIASSGPPWILGLRGSPLEAPENTLAGLRRALDLGLDGIGYDVRACATGEPLLLRDETLERTSDGRGRLAERTLPELAALDCGTWFRARFRGEPLAHLDEALEVGASPAERETWQVLWLREPGLVSAVHRAIRRLPGTAIRRVRVASTSHETCLEARDAGLEAMLVIPRADEDAARFVRDERLRACGVLSGGFGAGEWSSERWSIGADAPEELLAACRAPLDGILTREPARALSLRALVALAPRVRGSHPLRVPVLEVRPGALTAGRGDWCGAWSCAASVANPLPFPIEVTAGLVPRHGAFETQGLPRRFALPEGGVEEIGFRLTGGSWRVGGDPLFIALCRWKRSRGRRAGALLLDAPLARVRTAVADALAQRLTLLREAPGDRPASMVARRRGRHLFVAIESAAGYEHARTIVHLDGRFLRGGRGVRALLPEDFDTRTDGIAFSCGFEAEAEGERAVRRWAGGIPDEDGAGAPGRLLPLRSA